MRRIGLTSLVILALAAGIGAARATSLADVKSNGYIRGASANEVPYSYMDENGTAKGIGPDVAVAVLKSMGVNEIDWTVTPFGSLIPGLKARRYDFVAAEMRRNAALREHRQIVRDRQGMAEIMRDEDHSLPLDARMYDMIQHPSRLPHRERGSRLVEHEKRGAEKHRACDRERLALAA